MTTLRVGTHSSRLAIAQTNLVVQNFKELAPNLEIETVVIQTKDNETARKPDALTADKSLFTAEMEAALLDNEIDLAVYNAKDLPATMTEELFLAAVPQRMDPFEAFVSNNYRSLSDLPKNANVGVSGMRRKAELLRFRSDLNIVDTHGDVESRLQKLDEGALDAVMLAKNCLDLLELKSRIRAVISMSIMLPAAGQGALALQTRANDKITVELAARLNHRESELCVLTERAFINTLNGGGDLPAAALAEACCGNVILTGALFEPNGHVGFVESVVCTENTSISSAQKLAHRILEMGGSDILAKLK